MHVLVRSPQARIILWALLASCLTAACAWAVTLYVIRQSSLTQLEAEMARTAGNVVELMADVVRPLAAGTAAATRDDAQDGLSRRALEKALRPIYSRFYMSGEWDDAAGVNTAIELVCVLEGGIVRWVSTSSPPEAEEVRCAVVPPLGDDCPLKFPSETWDGIGASEGCFVASADGYEFRRDVRDDQRWLTIRVLSNLESHNRGVNEALLRVAPLTTIPVAIVSGVLVGFGLLWRSMRLRRFAQAVEDGWAGGGHWRLRDATPPAEFGPVADQLTRFHIQVNRARQDVLCLAVDFARAVEHISNDLASYRDKVDREERLSDDDVDDLRSIGARAGEVTESYLAGVVALNETPLRPVERPRDIPIDVRSVIGNAIDTVTWLEGKRDVELLMPATDVRISGQDIAERHFEAMMFELVKNAFRYSNNRIRIRVEEAGAVIRITIENDGHGLPKSERERVWQWGYPARADGRGCVGGIGLALVRGQLDLVGGRRELGASDLGGALITVELPSA